MGQTETHALQSLPSLSRERPLVLDLSGTESATGQYVGGDRLIVNDVVPATGQETLLGPILRDSSGKAFVIRFWGNRKAAEEEHTGWITCLESWLVGITSNAAYPLISSAKRFFEPNSLSSGNPEFLSSGGNRSTILSYTAE